MYKKIKRIPETFDIVRCGQPLVCLEDEKGSQLAIGIDNHCYVLWNGSKTRPFVISPHWCYEAAIELFNFIYENPDFKP